MKYQFLYEALPFLKNVEKERQEQFEEYFRNAPMWLVESFQIENLKKGDMLTREGEPAREVYFIGEGIVEGVDYRILGAPYDFMQFNKVYAFGGLEFIMGLENYRTTLRAVTNCTIVKIPRSKFDKWMNSDILAVKHEAKQVCEYLLEEGRNSRLFLFLQGADRLALLFIEKFERNSKNDVLYVMENRQNLADETGLSLKSINRGVKKFWEAGLLTKRGNQLIINKEQYEGLKEMLSSEVDLGK
jgi:CRP/FNR family cyclic AMP-dependent transcriptional regulator